MRRVLIAAMVAAVGLLAAAPAASASFHDVDVSEVYAGSAGNPESDFVELQMWDPFQNLVSAGKVRVYTTADGLTFHDITPTGNVAGTDNNRTVLIADSAFTTEFPLITPDFTNSALDINPTVGAVCWPTTTIPHDCISWGAFMGALPDGAYDGTDAPSPTTTQSLTRSITANCSTLLENADDTDTAADFSLATPSPRPNTMVPTESPCVLTVSTTGFGTVTGTGINCPGDCSQPFPGGMVTLTATPTNGASFDSWTGCAMPSGNQCTLDMSSSKSVSATFGGGALPTPPPTMTPVTTTTATPPAPIAAKKKCKKGFKLKKGKCRKKK